MRYRPQRLEEIADKLGIPPRVLEQYLNQKAAEAAPAATTKTKGWSSERRPA